MRLLPVFIAIAASGASATAFVLWATSRIWLPVVVELAPRHRARWLLAALSAPALGGSLAILLAFGPCWTALLAGRPDGCGAHAGESFTLCLFMPEPVSAAMWVVAGIALLPIVVRSARLVHGAWRTSVALGALRALGHYDGVRGAWIVPGSIAAVAGLPRAKIYLGETLLGDFPEPTIAIVLAHERAHVAHRDLERKTAARMLGAAHVPALARALHDGLDLALEQACDAAAAATCDPVQVAQALVDLARRSAPATATGLGLSLDHHLEERVMALCAPAWRSSAALVRRVTLGVAVVIACGVFFDDPIHEFVETVLARLSG